MNPNAEDQITSANAPSIELHNNIGAAQFASYPPLQQNVVIPPVSMPGPAYPPSSPFIGGNHHTAATSTYTHAGPYSSYPPTTPHQPPYPAASNCPYPQVQQQPILSTTHSGAQTQFPYPPPQSFADPTVPPYVPGAATSTYTSPNTPSHHYVNAYPPATQVASNGNGYPPAALPFPPQTPHQYPVVQSTSGYPGQANQTYNTPVHPPVGIVAPAPGIVSAHSIESTISSTSAGALQHHHASAPVKQIELGNPTVKPAVNFNPQADASELRDTLKQQSPNKDILINILCHRNLEQRFEIAKIYKELATTDLVDDIKEKFDSNFQKILIALLTPLIDFYVQELNESLDMYDHDSTIDIMCPLSNYEMYTLKYVYQKKYGIPLETEVQSKTSEHLKRLLLAICTCSRDESGVTNLAAAQFDARQLSLQENPYDDEQFCYYKDIFSTRNFQQIKLINEEYQKLTGQPLEKVIKSKFFMDDKQGYLCIVRYSQDKYGFFAKRFHRSMAGMGTNDNQLIRLVVTRCEIDLQDIKETFARMFGKTLRSWIKGDTSGHYKYCLYELIGEKRSNKYGICCKCW